MSVPYPLYNTCIETKSRKILTEAEHHIPGLRMIGRSLTSQAAPPLQDHYHPGCFEFSYMVRGNISFSVDGRDYPLSGGDLFLTFPDEIHSTGSTPMSLHKLYWFQLEAGDPDRFLFLRPETARQMIRRLLALPTRVLKLDSIATELFRMLFAALEEGTPEGSLQAAALLQTLLCQILRHTSSTGQQISPDIARARDYILQHLDQPLPLEELAGQSMLSLSRFKQKFKDQLGIAPRNFINFHKIELAKRLLDQGKSATDTAMQLGFSGSDYFSVVFRRYTSLSPSEYRSRPPQP